MTINASLVTLLVGVGVVLFPGLARSLDGVGLGVELADLEATATPIDGYAPRFARAAVVDVAQSLAPGTGHVLHVLGRCDDAQVHATVIGSDSVDVVTLHPVRTAQQKPVQGGRSLADVSAGVHVEPNAGSHDAAQIVAVNKAKPDLDAAAVRQDEPDVIAKVNGPVHGGSPSVQGPERFASLPLRVVPFAEPARVCGIPAPVVKADPASVLDVKRRHATPTPVLDVVPLAEPLRNRLSVAPGESALHVGLLSRLYHTTCAESTDKANMRGVPSLSHS